jgi:hypothetical protein
MFEKSYEDRLTDWVLFRNSLETSQNPLQDTVDLYKKAPLVSFQVDPFDQSTWLTPWEILKENIYCDFVKILAICYTLQLTERFSQSEFEIHITHDEERSSTDYLLFIGDMCIGYDNDQPILIKNLPQHLIFDTSYRMPPLN